MNRTDSPIRARATLSACNDFAVQGICYALCKQIPDMARGFTVHTSYGDIEIEPDDAKVFVTAMKRLLGNKLHQLERSKPA
jgi:hypothetical protein